MPDQRLQSRRLPEPRSRPGHRGSPCQASQATRGAVSFRDPERSIATLDLAVGASIRPRRVCCRSSQGLICQRAMSPGLCCGLRRDDERAVSLPHHTAGHRPGPWSPATLVWVTHYQDGRRPRPPHELSVGVAKHNLVRDRDVSMVLLPFRQHYFKVQARGGQIASRGAHRLGVQHNQSSITQPRLLERQPQGRLRRCLAIECNDHRQPRIGMACTPVAGREPQPPDM